MIGRTRCLCPRVRLGDNYETLPSGEAFLADWLVPGERPARRLSSRPIRTIERTAIDQATSYRRSSRDTYLQKLAARRLVEPAGPGAVRASALLFDRRAA